MNKAAIESIDRILKKGSGTLINRCFAIYNIVEESGEEFGESLKYVFENHGFIESDKTDQPLFEISKNEQEEWENAYGDIVDGIIKAFIKRKYESEIEFYEELWKTIESALFNDAKAKAFALYYALIDKRLPYYVVSDGVKMKNSEFVERQSNLVVQIRKLKFILFNDDLFEQKTEKASLLLGIINSVEDVNDRVVLFAYVISDIEEACGNGINNISTLLRQLISD